MYSDIRLFVHPTPYYLVEGVQVPVEVKKSPRAKKMRLKIRYPRNVQIVVPTRISVKAALRFAEQEQQWVAEQISRIPQTKQLIAGELVPYLGETYEITEGEGVRGGVTIQNNKIIVFADPPHIPRRTRDWFRKQAKQTLENKCLFWSGVMGLKYQRMTVRDQKTRWGSCSSSGSLNFSWRLIMMPEEVLEYVVIHELAHLRHLNHGPAFWALVKEHCPNFEKHQSWLKKNGRHVHKYDTTM